MDLDKSWIKFLKSGSVADYLEFVSTAKENEIVGRDRYTVLDRGACNKRSECGRE